MKSADLEQQIKSASAAGVGCKLQPGDLNDYFGELSSEAVEHWPFRVEGYRTVYTGIQKIPYNEDPANPFYGVRLEAELSDSREKLKMTASFFMTDDQVSIHWDNLYRMEGKGHSRVAVRLLNNLREFIRAQDRQRKDRKTFPSEILLEATSNNDRSGIAGCGGYIWAGQGFDFADAETRKRLWNHFVSFSGRHGVVIKPEDYKFFTKPVHFFSFNCGVRIKDKFGASSYLGKAFLLAHEQWDGRIASTSLGSEESRYASVFNAEQNRGKRLPAALKKLNAGYRKMLQRYYRQYASEKTPNFLQKTSRLAAAGWQIIKKSSFGRL